VKERQPMIVPGIRMAPDGAARAIYGQILVLSALAVVSEDPDLGTVDVLIAVVGTMLIFLSAHVYSELLARRIDSDRALSMAEVKEGVRSELPLIVALAPVAAALLLGAVGALSHDAAVDVALVVGVAALAGWGLEISLRSHFGLWRTLLTVGTNLALGIVIVALKGLLH
jgi:hypothetical protein